MTDRVAEVRRPRGGMRRVGSGPPHVSLSGDATPAWRAQARGDSALERTMDQIGMGRYHWTLLVCDVGRVAR